MSALLSQCFWDVWFASVLSWFENFHFSKKILIDSCSSLKKILSLKLETWNLEHGTWNWKLDIWNWELEFFPLKKNCIFVLDSFQEFFSMSHNFFFLEIDIPYLKKKKSLILRDLFLKRKKEKKIRIFF